MNQRMVLAGSLAQKPRHGGHTWVFLQYLLGFKRLDRVQSDGARSAATDRRVQDEVVKAAKELKEGATKLSARPHSSRKRKVAKAAAASALAVGAVIVAKKSMSHDEDEFEYTP